MATKKDLWSKLDEKQEVITRKTDKIEGLEEAYKELCAKILKKSEKIMDQRAQIRALKCAVRQMLLDPTIDHDIKEVLFDDINYDYDQYRI